MILGTLNDDREAVVRLVVRGRFGRELETEVVVDTGYDGFLTLPSELITELDLPFRGEGTAVLADGKQVVFRIHEGVALWDGKPRRVPIDAADTAPLLGMALLYGHDLRIEVVEGGSVSIQALPLS
jgi:clan AA aspartic protease